jgi:hypothetical protein
MHAEHANDISTVSSKAAKPAILTRKHLSWQIRAVCLAFECASSANASLALRRRRDAREQISAEIHAHTPASSLLHACQFFSFHSALISLSAEWAQTFI